MAVITLTSYKTWAGITDTDDDLWLQTAVDAVVAAGLSIIGVDLSPSADTARTFDVCDADRRVGIPGGIRAFTAVEVSTDGTTWNAVTSDVRVGPLSHLRPPDEPGAWVEYEPHVYGTFSGYHYVKVTGTTNITFGWAAWPDELVQDALVAVQRMTKDRDQQGAYPSETTARRYLNMPLWRGYRARYFAGVS